MSRSLFRNIASVARREYVWRARSRTFVVTTLFLVVAALALALAPVAVNYFERTSGQKIGVAVEAADLTSDPVAILDGLLNAPAGVGSAPTDASGQKSFTVSKVGDVATARAQVQDGKLNALLVVDRVADGGLTFTLFTDDAPNGRTAQLVQQAATSIAVQDRLSRAGIAPSAQAGLFAPPTYEIRSPDPNRTAPKTPGLAQDVTSTLVGTGLSIFIFVAIILYGTWVAMSVVEEKSSRVMELILSAASPLELLSGKVVGVGAVALTQYVAVAVPAIVAMLFQGQIASLVLGEPAGSVQLPGGLTLPVLLTFTVFFVLGFAMYAVLFAAAGSLVSRQEDVNTIVMPMTLVSGVGYFVSIYASTGLFDLNAPWVIVLSHVPFLSPYLMVTRVAAGKVVVWEPFLAALLLLLTTVAAIWVAARIYSAGVLMYGQKPGVRVLLKAMQAAR